MFPISGPAFLVVYLSLLAAGLLARRLIRAYLARRNPTLADDRPALSAPEAGYLVAGAPRAYAARVLAARDGAPEATSLHTPDSEEHLVELGLILDAGQRAALRLWSAAIFGGLLAAGLARLWMGLSRGKPIGYLALLLLVVLGVLLWSVSERSMRGIRTAAGNRVLSTLSTRYKAGFGDTSCAMGFALFGWAALANNPAAQAHLSSHGIVATAAGGCSAGTACASGCSGGGGGGGGGCGGCGGS